MVLETTDVHISNGFAIKGSTRTMGEGTAGLCIDGTVPGSEALAVEDEQPESRATSWS